MYSNLKFRRYWIANLHEYICTVLDFYTTKEALLQILNCSFKPKFAFRQMTRIKISVLKESQKSQNCETLHRWKRIRLTTFLGDFFLSSNLKWKQWMKKSLDEILFWMKFSFGWNFYLDEIFIWNEIFIWMTFSFEEVFLWMKFSLDDIFPWMKFWVKFSLGPSFCNHESKCPVIGLQRISKGSQ